MNDIQRLTAALASGEDCWGPLADAYEDAGWEWHAERARRAAAPQLLLRRPLWRDYTMNPTTALSKDDFVRMLRDSMPEAFSNPPVRPRSRFA